MKKPAPQDFGLTQEETIRRNNLSKLDYFVGAAIYAVVLSVLGWQLSASHFFALVAGFVMAFVSHFGVQRMSHDYPQWTAYQHAVEEYSRWERDQIRTNVEWLARAKSTESGSPSWRALPAAGVPSNEDWWCG